jgi:thiamine-phosphate pyrophosphorylase
MSSIKGIYLVTNRELCGQYSLLDVVKQAIDGGVSLIQLRDKHISNEEFIAMALPIKKLTQAARVPLIINDRVDVAIALGAEGVHIGQNDLPAATVVQLMGPGAIVGLSVETIAQVQQAEKLPVSYLGVSPVFKTPTKTDTVTEWGLEGLRQIRAVSTHKLVAIGSITPGNAAGVLEAGADCLAVISAICAAPSPRKATETLVSVYNRAAKHNY